MQTSNTWRILSWVAVGLVMIAAILETIEGDYLKAAATYCLALVFLLLAVGGTSAMPPWKKITLALLMLLWLGLFAYRLVVKSGV